MKYLALLFLLLGNSILYSQYPHYNPFFPSHIHNASEITFSLDSAYWLEPNDDDWVVKRIYRVSERNYLGKMLKGSEYKINDANEFEVTKKWTSNYTDDGTLNHFLKEIWNPDSIDWVLNEKQAWNEAGHLVENRDLFWLFKIPMACSGWGRLNYYNNNNQLIENKSLAWNLSKGWRNTERVLYSFDTNSILTQYKSQKWDSETEEWYDILRWDYFYEGNNNTYSYIYRWKPDLSSWEKLWKKTQVFDSNDWLVEVRYFKPVSDTSYQNHNKFIISRNEMGREIEKISERYDTAINDWKNFEIYSWEYQFDTLMTKYWYKSWNTDSGIWRNVYRRNWEYTDDLQLSYTIKERGDGSNWKNSEQELFEFYNDVLINYEKYNWKFDINHEGYWAPQYREEYYWPNGVGIFEERFNDKKAVIYPNPVNDYLNVKVESGEVLSLTIYNLNGKEIGGYHSLITDKSIDISKLINGIYLLKIETQTSIMSKKFIKH